MIGDGEYTDDLPEKKCAEIAKLADKGDEDGLLDALLDAGIDLRAGKLYILVKSEAKRLDAITKDSDKLGGEVHRLQQELEFTYRCPSADPAAMCVAVNEISAKIAKLTNQQEHARIASIHLIGLQRRWPKLFGLQMVGVGEKAHWPPAEVHACPPLVMQELNKLGLSDCLHPERGFEPIALPIKPRKRLPARF
jgi:hypothetical protein